MWKEICPATFLKRKEVLVLVCNGCDTVVEVSDQSAGLW